MATLPDRHFVLGPLVAHSPSPAIERHAEMRALRRAAWALRHGVTRYVGDGPGARVAWGVVMNAGASSLSCAAAPMASAVESSSDRRGERSPAAHQLAAMHTGLALVA